MIEHAELIELGFSRHAIAHRLKIGRLFPTGYAGVYAAGTPTLSRKGGWYAATRACGEPGGLSHGSAAAFAGIGVERIENIEISVIGTTPRRHEGLTVHRRIDRLRDHFIVVDAIPVTSPLLTVVDVSPRLSDRGLDRMINEAVGRGFFDPRELHDFAASIGRIPGAARVVRRLRRRTFRLSRSELEREFRPLLEQVGLPEPQTLEVVNGHEVDFWIEEISLVIEADSWGWYRTPAQLALDTERDHAHLLAGCIPLRFSHEQIHYSPDYVISVLERVVERLRTGSLTASSR